MLDSIANRSARRSLTIRAASIVVMAGLAAGLAGCEQNEREFEQAISEARTAISVLTAGGSWPADDEIRGPKLQAIISDLNQAMAEVEDDAKAPAQLLIARATAGQADIDMTEANAVASQIGLGLTRADAVARLYSTNLAIASTRVGPDASEAAETIEAQIRDIDAQIRQFESERQDLNRQLEEVRNRIAQLMESARAQRLEEGELRAQSLEAEPMRRAELIAEAVKRSREAEAYELSASEEELTVDSLTLAISQIDRFIENQRALRAIQTSGLERISTIDEGIRSRRQAQVRAAEQTLSSYNESLNAAIAQYEAEFVDAVNSATSGYSNASSMARQARAMGQLASTASGEHASAAARAHELHAQLASQFAASVQYLLDLDALSASDSQRFASIAERFRGEADQAIQSAAELYETAAGSFGGAGADGQSISERYRALAATLRGEEYQPEDNGSDDQSWDDGDQNDGSDAGDSGFGDSGSEDDQKG